MPMIRIIADGCSGAAPFRPNGDKGLAEKLKATAAKEDDVKIRVKMEKLLKSWSR